MLSLLPSLSLIHGDIKRRFQFEKKSVENIRVEEKPIKIEKIKNIYLKKKKEKKRDILVPTGGQLSRHYPP